MKTRIIIFITDFLFTLNFLIPTKVLSSGPPPAKKVTSLVKEFFTTTLKK